MFASFCFPPGLITILSTVCRCVTQGNAWDPALVCPDSCPVPCLPQPPNYAGPGCPDSCLTPCRAEAVRAGSAVMDAILGAWPTAQVLSTYGPWLSTSESHAHVSFLPDFAKENPIVGSFIVGFMQSLHQHRTSRAADQAAQSQSQRALVLDGAECYLFSNKSQVLEMKHWMKYGMANTPIVPAALRADFPALETVSPGVYDFPGHYRGRGPGNPAMWESDLVAALEGMDEDGVSWAYSEKYDWFGLGMHDTGKQPVPQAWIDATVAAMKKAQV